MRMLCFLDPLKRVRRRLAGAVSTAGVALLLGCCSVQYAQRRDLRLKEEAMIECCEAIRRHLRAWERPPDSALEPLLAQYAEHFGFPTERVSHTMGTVRVGDLDVAVQRFAPKQTSRGTVVLVHGYLDHAGVHARFVRRYAARGCTVVAYDMPGHGLSGGERAAVDSFHTYANALGTVLREVCTNAPRPLHIVAHSTGCSAVLEHLHRNQSAERPSSTDGVVLVAPLVYSWGTGPSKLGNALARPFVKRVPRIQKRVSHDPGFMRFVKHGNPLRIHSVPLAWFDALQEWQSEVEQWSPLSGTSVVVLQGTHDKVVSWRRNLKVLKRITPNATVHTVEGGFHQLLNEDAEHRRPVYEVLDRVLLGPADR